MEHLLGQIIELYVVLEVIEFIAKMNIVLEEADETLFWLEIIIEKNWIDRSQLETIWKEANELTAIFVSSLKTVNNRINKLNQDIKV